MQQNPNPNDIVRIQSQQHQGFPFNAQQYTLPITSALSQPPQQPPQQALHQLQQPQLPQRRPRNMKKVPANAAVIPPLKPIQTQITFQQFLAKKCQQDQFLFKIFSPNFNLLINNNIIKLLNPFFEDPNHYNFLKQLPVPCLFEPLPEFEPKVYFPPNPSMIQPNQMMGTQSGYEFKLDTTKPSINKVFLVCYYLNKNLQMVKFPNMKLSVSKFGSNASDFFDCFHYGESEQYFYYIINATRIQYPIYITPPSDSLLFVVVPCKPRPEEMIKKAILSKKTNVPADLSQVNVCCPCHHQTYLLDNLINLIFTNGDVICNACKKPIVFDKLEVINSDSPEHISLILYYNFQSKNLGNTDLSLVDEFINPDSNENKNSEDKEEFQMQDFQNSQEYIDSYNNMFSS